MIEGLSETETLALKKVWNQQQVPVILRRTGKGEMLRARLPSVKKQLAPYRSEFEWLSACGKSNADWNTVQKCWELPKLWFNNFVNRALESYGRVYVIQPYREHEVCAPACQNASGHECNCSCMGEHHGTGGDSSWFEVSETFAVRWGEKSLASRLMTKKVHPVQT
jgi:hypothetical protein